MRNLFILILFVSCAVGKPPISNPLTSELWDKLNNKFALEYLISLKPEEERFTQSLVEKYSKDKFSISKISDGYNDVVEEFNYFFKYELSKHKGIDGKEYYLLASLTPNPYEIYLFDSNKKFKAVLKPHYPNGYLSYKKSKEGMNFLFLYKAEEGIGIYREEVSMYCIFNNEFKFLYKTKSLDAKKEKNYAIGDIDTFELFDKNKDGYSDLIIHNTVNHIALSDFDKIYIDIDTCKILKKVNTSIKTLTFDKKSLLFK